MDVKKVKEWFNNAVVINASNGDHQGETVFNLIQSYQSFHSLEQIEKHNFLPLFERFLDYENIQVKKQKKKLRGVRVTVISGIHLKSPRLSVIGSFASKGHGNDWVNDVCCSNSNPIAVSLSSDRKAIIHATESKNLPSCLGVPKEKSSDSLDFKSKHVCDEHKEGVDLTVPNAVGSVVLKRSNDSLGKSLITESIVEKNELCGPFILPSGKGQVSIDNSSITKNAPSCSDESKEKSSCNLDLQSRHDCDQQKLYEVNDFVDERFFESAPSEFDQYIGSNDMQCQFDPICDVDTNDGNSIPSSSEVDCELNLESTLKNRRKITSYLQKENDSSIQKPSNPPSHLFVEKPFSFRTPAKEPFLYNNLVFSRFYQNFKTITRANMPLLFNFERFEDFLDSEFPISTFREKRLTDIILRAKYFSNSVELRMNVFLCGAFRPIITGNVACTEIDYLESNLSIPQFTAISSVGKLKFRCEVCGIYREYLQRAGKSCKIGSGTFEGMQQLYSHAVANHHGNAISFLTKNMTEKQKPIQHQKKEHVSDYFKALVSEKGKTVSCMFLWDLEVVRAFKNSTNIRGRQAKTLFHEQKPWRNCEGYEAHSNCRQFKDWEKNHPIECKELREEAKTYSRSIFVPGSAKIIVHGKSVCVEGGIKSLEPMCLGTAESIGPHPYTCENCHKQRIELRNLMLKRKRSSLPTSESRVGKRGFKNMYATKQEKEQRYVEIEQQNEVLRKQNKEFHKMVYSKANWQTSLLESCNNGDIKKLLIDLVSLLNQKDRGSALKREIIKNLLGKLRSGVNHKFSPIIKDVAIYYHNSLGPDKYSLLQDLFGLPGKTTAKAHGQKTKLQLGLNDEVFEKGIELYDGAPVLDCTDEARTLRFISAIVNKKNGKIEIIGQCWDPNIEAWDKSRVFLDDVISEEGFQDEFSALKSYVDKVIQSDQLAKDTGIHNLIQTSGIKSKPLIYLVWPTPNKGYCASHLLKIWDVVRCKCFLLPSGELRENRINLIGHSSDSASFQLAAAVSLMTPQKKILAKDVKYLTLGVGESQFAAPYFGPLPSIPYCDFDHCHRLFLKCLKYDTLDLEFFPSKSHTYIASINHLQELKQILDDKGISHLCSFSNNDLLFARFLDQNCDAALKVFTNNVGDLLEEYVPSAKGTILYIRGVVSLFHPFLHPQANPISMQESLSEGITVFRLWRKILEKKSAKLNAVAGAAKNPSNRGRFITYGCYKTAEILFAAGTFHMLAIYSHFKKLGPTALSLFNCGTKSTERIISEVQGKTNQFQSLDSQPTLSGIITNISKVQQNKTAEENLLELGAKKASTTNRRRLAHEMKEVEKSDYEYPDNFAEFKKHQQVAFKRGVDKGIDLFKKYCPEGLVFLQKNGGLSFLTGFKNNVPLTNVFDGSVSPEYALEKLTKLKPSDLLTNSAMTEENTIINYFNPEDVPKENQADSATKNDEKDLISDQILDDLESNDLAPGDKNETDEGRKWLISRVVNGEKKEIHLSQALKILVPREYVSRERSRRHIAAKFLPDRGELSENHNVVLFRFVAAKVAGKMTVCKVASLNCNGKSVKSASSLDENVTCQLIPLEKVPSKQYLYRLPAKIIVSNWLKLSNIVGELKMSCNVNMQFELLEKSRSVLCTAERNLQESKDATFARSLSKGLLPADFREVNDIIDRKIDPKSEEYLYLVKFKGEDQGDPVWLNQSCFDRPVHYSKRKGFDSSEKLVVSESSFSKFALNDGQSISGKPPAKKRKITSPLPLKAIKKTKIPSISQKSLSKLNAFSFDKTGKTRSKAQESSAIVVEDFVGEIDQRNIDEVIFEEALKNLEDGNWLNDVIVQKASEMIKAQFPQIEGLQDPLKSKSKNRSKLMSVGKGESLQIHHDGEFHWVLSASKGNDVFVYDSLYNKPTENLKEQLVLCYKHFIENGFLKVKFKNVFKQKGTQDCGLYVIAYAIDVARGKSPEGFVYNQAVMRKHLSECFKKNELDPFPVVINNHSVEPSSEFMIKAFK